MVSDDATYRVFILAETFNRRIDQSEVKHKDKDEKGVYEMYYEFSEPVRSLVSHRTLALNRGEKEDILRVTIIPPEERLITYLEKKVIKKVRMNLLYRFC